MSASISFVVRLKYRIPINLRRVLVGSGRVKPLALTSDRLASPDGCSSRIRHILRWRTIPFERVGDIQRLTGIVRELSNDPPVTTDSDAPLNRTRHIGALCEPGSWDSRSSSSQTYKCR